MGRRAGADNRGLGLVLSLAIAGCADDSSAAAQDTSTGNYDLPGFPTTAPPPTTASDADAAGSSGGAETTAGSTSIATQGDSSTDGGSSTAVSVDSSSGDASSSSSSGGEDSTSGRSSTSTGPAATGSSAESGATDTGVSEPGPCCEATGTPSCENAIVADCTCTLDAFCCTDAWDLQCVETAQTFCALGCDGVEGDCCVAHAGVGCEDTPCQEDMCSAVPACCAVGWGTLCADLAGDHCAVCDDGSSDTAGPASDCCFANGTPGCEDPAIEACVCAMDSFCCGVTWDVVCAILAENSCDAPC